MKPSLILIMLMFALMPQQDTASLTLKVTGFKNEKGVVRALLFKGENGFPEATEKAIRSASFKIVGTQAEFDFENLPPGRYAVSLFHDSENTGKLRTNLVGIPKDGYGFSNNAMGTLGPPSFKEASFQITAGKNTHIIKLKH